ncbi:hypothetical protein LINGRAPRIM_LOCUS366 [Linum grandiflorum]
MFILEQRISICWVGGNSVVLSIPFCNTLQGIYLLYLLQVLHLNLPLVPVRGSLIPIEANFFLQQ